MATKHGGRRAGAGRPAGALNKSTKTLKEKAALYGDDALAVLLEIATDQSAPPSARVAAANGLLDRGYGRPTQSVELEQTASTVEPAALIALSEAMERSREQRRAIMERRRQMGFTGD